jgi:phage tail-like protein
MPINKPLLRDQAARARRATTEAARGAARGAAGSAASRSQPFGRRPAAGTSQTSVVPARNAPTSTPAPISLNDDSTLRLDPHLGLRFWIQLGQIEIAGFRECSGLQISTEVHTYHEGGLNGYEHKLPTRVKYENITLKRGMDFGLDLFNWYYAASRGLVKRQNISIVLYANEVRRNANRYLVREAVQRWDLQNAWPCRWTGPDLNAEKGAMAVESVELAHEGLLSTTLQSDNSRSNAFTSTNSSSNSSKPGKGRSGSKKTGQFI